MKVWATSFLTAGCVLALLSGVVGCESNSMDRDLKRQADRATIQLNQVQNERDALQTELRSTKVTLDDRAKQLELLQKDNAALRQQIERNEADLIRARQRVRELEEAALAARQGMPTTRAAQP